MSVNPVFPYNIFVSSNQDMFPQYSELMIADFLNCADSKGLKMEYVPMKKNGRSYLHHLMDCLLDKDNFYSLFWGYHLHLFLR